MTSSIGVTLGLSLNMTGGADTFVHSPAGQWCSLNKVGVLASFVPPTPSAADAAVVLAKCEQFCATSTSCWGCRLG